jgi:alpha-1,4-N-acetylglucosaminyltransferase EXTL3
MFLSIFAPIFKMRLSRLLLVVVVVLVAVPLVTHYFLVRVDHSQNQNLNLENMDPEAARNKLKLLDLDGLSGNELKDRIDDLLRIKHSVLTELRYIEQDRAEKLKQKSEMDRLINRLKAQATREQSELEKLRVSITQAQMLQKELTDRNNPEVLPPLQLRSLPENNFVASQPVPEVSVRCTMGSCFDLARCPLSSGFPVFFYESTEATWVLDGDGFGYRSSDPDSACLFVALVDFRSPNNFEADLQHWKGDGRNHLLVDVSTFSEVTPRQTDDVIGQKPSGKIRTGKALVAGSEVFSQSQKFRRKFDLSLPSFNNRVLSAG